MSLVRATFARLYDAVMAPAERGPLGRLRDHALAGLAGPIVEIGAGTGASFRHYPASSSVVATDPDLAMLARARDAARRAAAPVLLVAADAGALPFRDGAFAGGVATLALCTVPCPAAALGELRRVVVAGGSLRLVEHVRASAPAVARLQDWLTPVWRRCAGGCHLNRRTAAAVAKAGFVVEHRERHAAGAVELIAAHAPAR